jgi:hypothetical protein
MRPGFKQITWLCLLLTLFWTYSFAAHQHFSPGDEAQCTICVVAQSASPVPTSVLPSAFLVLTLLILLAALVSAKQRLVPFALRVRPPPEIQVLEQSFPY